jgi:hypothetical protein
MSRHSATPVRATQASALVAQLTCSPRSGQVEMLESSAGDWLLLQSRLNWAGVR